MEADNLISHFLKSELWHSDQRGSTTVGGFLTLLAVVCAIVVIERLVHSNRASQLRKAKSEIHETRQGRWLASANYRDDANMANKVFAQIQKASEGEYVLTIITDTGGVVCESCDMFSSLDLLVVHLESQTILRVGDFKAVL